MQENLVGLMISFASVCPRCLLSAESSSACFSWQLPWLLTLSVAVPGWQFGSSGGRCGLFPTSLVQLAPAPDYLSTSMDRRGEQRKREKASPESRNTSKEVSSPWGGTPMGHGWVLWELPGWVHSSGIV